LELLFGKKKKHTITLPVTAGTGTTPVLRDLLKYVELNLIQERPELFMLKDTVRPGILVLINEVDWELEGGADYPLKANDTIVFISTLHGG